MAYQKLYVLIDKLAHGTDSGVIVWEETENNGIYQSSFSDVSVRIAGHNEDYVVSIYDAEGSVVESFSDADLDGGSVGAYYSKMKNIYETARRQARGTEQVLDKIIKEIDDDEVIF